jgi:hypothetical protein
MRFIWNALEIKLKEKMMSRSIKLASAAFVVALCSIAIGSTAQAAKMSEVKPEKIFVFELHTDAADAQTSEKSASMEARKKEAMKEDITRREIIIKQATMGGMMNGAQIVRMGEKTVKNAPYSAEVITEKQQKLADGNLIASKISSLSYRDSQGRTREEIRDAKGEVRLIMIHDPSEGRITLNPKTKTATKIMSSFQWKDGSKMPMHIVTENRSKSADGKESIEIKLEGEVEAKADRIIVMRRSEKAGEGKGAARESSKSVTMDVRGTEGGRSAGMHFDFMSDAGVATIFGDMKWSAKRQTKILGSRDFDGVKAEGKLVSYEIPAGEIGNTNPILVSDESWTSPELQIAVYSKHSDPRSGDRIYRLQNLKREEIPASMFAVPSDYKLKDLSKMIGKEMKFDGMGKMDKADKAPKIEKEMKIEKK